MTSFRGLAHRLEIVRELDGVLWINDSKATNIASTRVALESMTRPTVLLLGGRHKGEPYTHLLDALRGTCARRDRVRRGGTTDRSRIWLVRFAVEQVDRWVRGRGRAGGRGRTTGDVVLLSPACSSFDMFDNYEQRGERFKTLVAQLAQAVNG